MAVVGKAEVLVVPTFTGAQKKIKDELGGIGTQAGKQGGASLGSSLAKWGKRGAMVAGGAIAAVTGTALVKGFGRLTAIENAQAKLRGLGHDANSVKAIMNDALAAVKGTAFGMDEAASVAATAVAAGVKPGKDLERTLRLVGDAATIGGASLGEMGSIFSKVATSNKIQGEVIAQLGDRGIPIIQLLSKELGKSAEETVKLASEGKINFETFRNAIENGMGGAALKSGETFQGAMKNTLAAVGRVGANLLSGIFPKIAPALGRIMEALGPIEDKAKVVGAAIGEWLGKAVERIGPIFSEVTGGIRAFVAAWKYNDGEITSSGFPGFMERVGFVARRTFDFLKNTAIPTLRDVAKWMLDNKNVVFGAVAAFGALVAITKIHAAVMAVQAVGGLVAYIKSAKIVQSVTKAWAAVQWALSAAVSATPIGLIIVGLVALGAALVIAYQKSETFRDIVQAI